LAPQRSHPIWAKPAERPRRAQATDEESLRPIEPVGATALFLGCAALLCASFRPLAGWLVPLSVTGLIGGVTAIIRAKRTARFRLTFPIGGTAVAATVLLVALVFPGLLGPFYQSSRPRQVDPQSQAIFRMVLPGDSRSAGPDDPVWANASRFALCQEKLTVQVIEVTVTEQRCLQICLRIMGEESSGLLEEENRPKLTDAGGTAYKLLDVKAASAPLAEGAKANAQVPATDAVYTFELPGGDAPTLHLEVPATACGGTGTFRFAIPSTMIKRP
jgi:hypothetical protein